MTYKELKIPKPKEKRMKTHTLDGVREGTYGGAAMAAAGKIWLWIPWLGPIDNTENLLLVGVLAGVITGIFKALRNYARKNFGISLGGSI